MSKQELLHLAQEYFEIELTYKGNRYSLTYYDDDRKNFISFCEFYKEILDVASIDELWESTYKGIAVKDIFLSLKGEGVDYSLF